MKVTMMLADSAQAVNGKLYILGGGWSITGPQPVPSAIALKIEVPWTGANQKHSLKLELVDSDFHPVLVPTPAGNAPVLLTGDFEVGRPAGLPPGTPLDIPFAFNIPPLLLAPGKRYVWKLMIDGDANNEWQVAFSTRPAPSQNSPTP
jgi:hypothetical protein